MKHATVQAATRSGVHSTALMRMRWVITQKPDPSQKARLVVLGFTRAQLGATPSASPTVSRRGRQFQDQRASEFSKRMLRRPFCGGHLKIKNCTLNRLQNCQKRWACNTTNAYNCEDRCTGRRMHHPHGGGVSGGGAWRVGAEDLENRTVFLGQNFV